MQSRPTHCRGCHDHQNPGISGKPHTVTPDCSDNPAPSLPSKKNVKDIYRKTNGRGILETGRMDRLTSSCTDKFAKIASAFSSRMPGMLSFSMIAKRTSTFICIPPIHCVINGRASTLGKHNLGHTRHLWRCSPSHYFGTRAGKIRHLMSYARRATRQYQQFYRFRRPLLWQTPWGSASPWPAALTDLCQRKDMQGCEYNPPANHFDR